MESNLNRRLPRAFYAQPTLEVARSLLGTRLVRQEPEGCTAGWIVETEAYRGEEDLACHARAGRTKRTAVMYGPPGHVYVYFTYGMHWLLNVVTEAEGFPAAVLIRAVQPTQGFAVIAGRRKGQPESRWTDGPGKLCQGFNIDGALNTADLLAPDAELSIEEGVHLPDRLVLTGPRVGIDSVPEPWKSIPWRFLTEVDIRSLEKP